MKAFGKDDDDDAPAAPADAPVAAATLALVAAQHGGRAFPSYHPLAQPGGPATRHGDATQPCKQPRAGDAPPPQGEAAAGGAVVSEAVPTLTLTLTLAPTQP